MLLVSSRPDRPLTIKPIAETIAELPTTNKRPVEIHIVAISPCGLEFLQAFPATVFSLDGAGDGGAAEEAAVQCSNGCHQLAGRIRNNL
jgi:hypothetical protein